MEWVEERRCEAMVSMSNGRTPTEQRLAHSMKDEVSLLLFVDKSADSSARLVDLAGKMASMSAKIVLRVEDADAGNNERMKAMHIENRPCLVLIKNGFTRIRYYGIPEGYETQALADAIVELSQSSPHLSTLARESLSKVRRKANIKVFVMTTCPFCPTVVRHAYRAAIGSENVTTEIIDTSMFPDLATRHSVMGVPKMVLNDSMDITGAVDEVDFFDKLHEADIALLDSMFG